MVARRGRTWRLIGFPGFMVDSIGFAVLSKRCFERKCVKAQMRNKRSAREFTAVIEARASKGSLGVAAFRSIALSFLLYGTNMRT